MIAWWIATTQPVCSASSRSSAPRRLRRGFEAAAAPTTPLWSFVTRYPPGRSTDMRDGPRRLPLIALGALGALIALILVGTYIYRESGAPGVLGALRRCCGAG